MKIKRTSIKPVLGLVLLSMLWLFSGTPLKRLSYALPDRPVLVASAEEVYGIVMAKDPSRHQRRISVKDSLFLSEEITTGWGGYLKMKMRDETLFTLGANSKLRMNEFQYDPDTHNGVIDVSVPEGVFRFETGEIVRNRPESMRVHMAVGVTAVRGTRVAGESKKAESFVVLEKKTKSLPGSNVHVTVINNVKGRDEETPLLEEGFGVEVKKGQAPGSSFKVPDDRLKKLQDKLKTPEKNNPSASLFDEADGLGAGQPKRGTPSGREFDAQGEPQSQSSEYSSGDE